MKYYFAQFKLVEVQQTFYKPPTLNTALNWRQEALPSETIATSTATKN